MVSRSNITATNMENMSKDRIGQRSFGEFSGDNVCPSTLRGIDFLKDPRLNKVNQY